MKNKIITAFSVLLSVAPFSQASASEMKYKEILREDFSLFTAGSEERHSASTVNDNLQYIPESKTHTPGWQGVEIYQAGGMAWQGAGGRLFTPTIDLSKNGGSFRVSFRMRLATGSEPGHVNVVHNQSIQSYVGEALTEEWKTYEIEMSGGVTYDYLCIRGVDISSPSQSKVEVLIDDIVVEVPDPDIVSPTGLMYGDFDGTSFNCSWNRVEGAEKYELQLSYKDDDGNTIYLPGDFITSATKYSFSDLEEKWNAYSLQVRAIAGENSSPWTAPVLIEGLPAPVLGKETQVSDTEFTARWSKIPGAVKYEVMTYYCHEAQGDEQFYHANTDFSFVRSEDDGTSIDYGFSSMPGWFFGAAELQDGFIGIQGAFAYLGYAAQIESPALELGASGGKLSVELKAKNDDVRTSLAIALFNPANGDFEMVDSMEEELSKNWHTVRASLTGGTDGSILALIPTRSGNVYIDDLKVWQNIKSGVEAKILADKTEINDTKAKISGLQCPAGDYVGYKVRAVGISADGMRWLYSAYTDLAYPLGKSAVENVADTTVKPKVYVNGLNISVIGEGTVDVYDLSGLPVASASCGETISLPSAGLYIVRNGAYSTKILVKNY